MTAALRVLVVDDSATVRATIAEVLQSDPAGLGSVELHEAQDGEEALLRAHLIAPDVILMDVQMPRMTGIEALKVIKRDDVLREIPVVMLSQMDAPADLAAALAAGAHDYLGKPFEPIELRARVAAAGRTGALVAELRRVNAQLDRAASTDQLTGLANRREVDRVMRGARSGTVAVALADIDHFKTVNDTWGHDVGDVVLQVVAGRLRRSLRDADVVGRWGGEEFVALLAGTDAAGAAAVCERARTAVAGPLSLDRGPQAVTISIGLAVGTTTDRAIDDLLKCADDALYQAKAGGRDQVVIIEM